VYNTLISTFQSLRKSGGMQEKKRWK